MGFPLQLDNQTQTFNLNSTLASGKYHCNQALLQDGQESLNINMDLLHLKDLGPMSSL